MRYVSIFSGVEAATLAWEPLGWEPLAFCEIDDFPSAVLAEHWPNIPNEGWQPSAPCADDTRNASQGFADSAARR